LPAFVERFAENLEKLIKKFDAEQAGRERLVALLDRRLELNKRRGGLGPPAAEAKREPRGLRYPRSLTT